MGEGSTLKVNSLLTRTVAAFYALLIRPNPSRQRRSFQDEITHNLYRLLFDGRTIQMTALDPRQDAITVQAMLSGVC